MSRRTTGTAGVVATVLALAACTTPLPTPQPDAVPAVVQPAVTTEQVEDVLAEIATTLEAADAAGTPEALDTRVTGPARTTRAVEYLLAAAGEPGAVTPIPADAQTVIAPATETWPRTVMVVTEPPEDLQAPLLLTLVQGSPREQFQLWSWARLFPGVQMPATAQPELGSPPVALDTDALVVPAGEVVARYTDVLTNRAASPSAPLFGSDPLSSGIVGYRDAFAVMATGTGSLTETYVPIEGEPYAIGTADGGAIVVGAFQTVTTITLTDSTLTITDPATVALLGKPTVTSNLAITWLSMVAFRIPPAGSSEVVSVLGAEHSRIQVTGE
ncbi:MAG: hypothetical protein JWP95_2088 [Actinotalea sp.]|nr:hypothetical protein [Actinotalea sp.]